MVLHFPAGLAASIFARLSVLQNRLDPGSHPSHGHRLVGPALDRFADVFWFNRFPWQLLEVPYLIKRTPIADRFFSLTAPFPARRCLGKVISQRIVECRAGA